MAEHSKIEWTDHTFNPWEGCTKVSPGCANCYAEARNHRWGLDNWGKGKPRRRTSKANWKQPLRWNKQAACCLCGVTLPFLKAVDHRHRSVKPALRRSRVFCASLADWLDDEVPTEWLADLLKLIHDTPNLDWLLLTKRPEDWLSRIQKVVGLSCVTGCDAQSPHGMAGWLANRWQNGNAPSNVWMGVTCEDQKRADERIPALLRIPAKVRFLSVEPMLEKMYIEDRFFCSNSMGERIIESGAIHWVICGGESGSKKRPFDPDWARSLRDQCKAAGVPFFMKQIDKIKAIPQDLMIREFPVVDGAMERLGR